MNKDGITDEHVEVLHCDDGQYMVYVPCGKEVAHCHEERIADWICQQWNARSLARNLEAKGESTAKS